MCRRSYTGKPLGMQGRLLKKTNYDQDYNLCMGYERYWNLFVQSNDGWIRSQSGVNLFYDPGHRYYSHLLWCNP
jgi:hypothetical protein